MVEFDDNLNPVEPNSTPPTQPTPPLTPQPPQPPTPPTPPAAQPAPASPTPPSPRPTSAGSPTWLVSGLVMLVVGFALGALLFGGNDRPATNTNPPTTGQPEGLAVSGDATVYASPDIAKVTLGIQKTGRTVAEVQEALSKATADITDAVKKQGIEDKDIKTTNFNVQPQYSGGNVSRISGYTGNHFVTITIRDLGKVDAITDSAVAAGANTVSNVSFTVEDPEKWWSEARSEALTEAKAKAKQIAKDADIRLGRIISINEWSNQPYPLDGYGGGVMPAEDMVKSRESGIQPGNLELQVNVSLVYQIN